MKSVEVLIFVISGLLLLCSAQEPTQRNEWEEEDPPSPGPTSPQCNLEKINELYQEIIACQQWRQPSNPKVPRDGGREFDFLNQAAPQHGLTPQDISDVFKNSGGILVERPVPAIVTRLPIDGAPGGYTPEFFVAEERPRSHGRRRGPVEPKCESCDQNQSPQNEYPVYEMPPNSSGKQPGPPYKGDSPAGDADANKPSDSVPQQPRGRPSFGGPSYGGPGGNNYPRNPPGFPFGGFGGGQFPTFDFWNPTSGNKPKNDPQNPPSPQSPPSTPSFRGQQPNKPGSDIDKDAKSPESPEFNGIRPQRPFGGWNPGQPGFGFGNPQRGIPGQNPESDSNPQMPQNPFGRGFNPFQPGFGFGNPSGDPATPMGGNPAARDPQTSHLPPNRPFGWTAFRPGPDSYMPMSGNPNQDPQNTNTGFDQTPQRPTNPWDDFNPFQSRFGGNDDQPNRNPNVPPFFDGQQGGSGFPPQFDLNNIFGNVFPRGRPTMQPAPTPTPKDDEKKQGNDDPVTSTTDITTLEPDMSTMMTETTEEVDNTSTMMTDEIPNPTTTTP